MSSLAKRRKLLDVLIDDVTMPEAAEQARRMLDSHAFHQVVTPGPEFLLEATANPRFRDILNRAALALPDGMGLKVAGILTGQSFRSRVTGVDFTETLLRLCDERQLRVFLYGGQPGVAELAAQKIQHRYPKVIIVGFESGWRGPWQKLHERRLVEKIHFAKPQVLLVALGAPKQELFIDAHRHAWHDVRIAMGVGRTFDYLAGITPRAPKMIRQLGLEWLMTFLQARRHYLPQFRRRRVGNATWRFLSAVLRERYG